jgi:ethanolamine ammonia-lyase small subunit
MSAVPTSAADSLGCYITWQPRPGLPDSRRNCVSNIRRTGLSYEAAAGKIAYLISEARRRRISRVTLKEDAPPLLGQGTETARSRHDAEQGGGAMPAGLRR